MQKSSILIISLISINIILVIICGFFYFKKDRSEPKIAFEANETVYTVGMDTNELLTGVTAVDNKDGDISDRIVVEKILENKDKNAAVVYYAVSDYDGNVTKASREFPAEYDIVASSEVSDAEAVETASADSESAEEKSAEELAAEEAARAEEERLAQEEAQRKAEEEEKAKAEAEAKKREEEERKAAEKAAAEAEKKAASSPFIELNYTECKVPIGGGVPWADAIKTLRDDKDGYARLFKNLVASKFDNTTAGDYEVTLYTVDSSKNKSNTVTMLVHVVQ